MSLEPVTKMQPRRHEDTENTDLHGPRDNAPGGTVTDNGLGACHKGLQLSAVSALSADESRHLPVVSPRLSRPESP